MKKSQSKLKTPTTKVIASRDLLSDFSALSEVLPNPDQVLNNTGESIAVYRTLLAESLVMGATTRLEGGIKALSWELSNEDASEQVITSINDALKRLPVMDICQRMIKGYYFGFQPFEILWQTGVNGWWPSDIVDKPPEWFLFDQKNQLRFRAKGHEQSGKLLPARRFVVAGHKQSYDNPYGMAVLSACYWPCVFEKGGLSFWLTFTEKFGIPFLIGKLKRDAQQSEYDALADDLKAMVQDGVLVMPDDGSIEVLDTSKAANVDIFEKLLAYCRSKINIAILGQNQTTEANANKASAIAGLEVTKAVVMQLSGMIESTFNQVIEHMVYYNFGETAAAPKFTLIDQEALNEKQSQRDERLHKIGLRFTPQYFIDEYNINAEYVQRVAGKKEAEDKHTDFAEGEDHQGESLNLTQQALEQMKDSVSETQLNVLMTDMLPAIESAINTGERADALADLATALPKMNSSALEALLTKLIFTAAVTGHLAAAEELADG